MCAPVWRLLGVTRIPRVPEAAKAFMARRAPGCLPTPRDSHPNSKADGGPLTRAAQPAPPGGAGLRARLRGRSVAAAPAPPPPAPPPRPPPPSRPRSRAAPELTPAPRLGERPPPALGTPVRQHDPASAPGSCPQPPYPGLMCALSGLGAGASALEAGGQQPVGRAGGWGEAGNNLGWVHLSFFCSLPLALPRSPYGPTVWHSPFLGHPVWWGDLGDV